MMPIATRIDAKQNWIRLFDPATALSNKIALSNEFDRDIKTAARRLQSGKPLYGHTINSVNPPFYYEFRKLRKTLEELESNTLVAVVMSGGYGPGKLIYSELECMQKASGFVLIGCSLTDRTKVFDDGTSMLGKIFITSKHLDRLQSHDGSILLVENEIETGRTIVTVGNGLRQFGIEQPMLRLNAAKVFGPFVVEHWQQGWKDAQVARLPPANVHDEKGQVGQEVAAKSA